MMQWVYALPVWLAGFVIIGGVCALAVCGLYLHAKYVRRGSDFAHNDVAGPVIGAAGTVLAVMMSMMLIGVWQEYDTAASFVSDESAALTDLLRIERTSSAPDARDLQSLVLAYTNVVVREEWPLMQSGASSDRATRLSEELLSFVANRHVHTTLEIDLVRKAIDARRSRLEANGQSIPAVLWWVMFFTGAVTIYLSYLFGVQKRGAHVLMTFALSAVIGSVYFAIAELDLPFQGPCALSANAFENVYKAAEL